MSGSGSSLNYAANIWSQQSPSGGSPTSFATSQNNNSNSNNNNNLMNNNNMSNSSNLNNQQVCQSSAHYISWKVNWSFEIIRFIKKSWLTPETGSNWRINRFQKNKVKIFLEALRIIPYFYPSALFLSFPLSCLNQGGVNGRNSTNSPQVSSNNSNNGGTNGWQFSDTSAAFGASSDTSGNSNTAIPGEVLFFC